MKQNMYTVFTLTFLIFLVSSSPSDQSEQHSPVRSIIIDADTGNEIDDQYAIVRALVEPSFQVKAICSAQYHTQNQAPENTVQISQNQNERILQLMNLQHIPHPIGSNLPLPDANTPQTSDAAQIIINIAHSMENGQVLDVVVLGAMTNVASAILMDSTIINKIRVHAMGLHYDPITKVWDKNEFNTNNDVNAMNLVLDTKGLDLQIMTASTSINLVFFKEVVDEKLKGKNGVWDFLVQRWEEYLLTKTWSSPLANETQWVMWDIAIIEALANPELATKVSVMTPPENSQRPIEVYREIDAEAMQKEYWDALEKAMKTKYFLKSPYIPKMNQLLIRIIQYYWEI